jgi:hypothetical protein
VTCTELESDSNDVFARVGWETPCTGCSYTWLAEASGWELKVMGTSYADDASGGTDVVLERDVRGIGSGKVCGGEESDFCAFSCASSLVSPVSKRNAYLSALDDVRFSPTA